MPAPNPSILANGLLEPDGILPIFSGYYSYNAFSSFSSLANVFPPGRNRILFVACHFGTNWAFKAGIVAFPLLRRLNYGTAHGQKPLMHPLVVHPFPLTMLFWIAIPDDDTGGFFDFDVTGAWQLWQDCDTEQPFQSTNFNHTPGGSVRFDQPTQQFVIAEPHSTTVIQARQDPVGLPVALFAIGGDSQRTFLTGPFFDVSALGVYPSNPTFGSDIGPAVDLDIVSGALVDLGDIHNLSRARTIRGSPTLDPFIQTITQYVASAWTLTKDTGYRAAWPLSPGTCGTPFSLIAGGLDWSTPDRGDIGKLTTAALVLRPDQAHTASPWVTKGWFPLAGNGAGFAGVQTYPRGSTLTPFSTIQFYNDTWTILPGGGLDSQPFSLPVQMNEDSAHFLEIAPGMDFAVARDTSGGVWTAGLDTDFIDENLQPTFAGSIFVPATHFDQLGQGANWPACASEVWLQVPGIVATSVDAGTVHAAALRGTEPPLLWGSNEHGQLGSGQATTPVFGPTGRYTGSGYPTPAVPIGLGTTPIAQVACGGYHTLLLDTAGALYVSGRNNFGQLGLNDVRSRNGFELAPGLPPIEKIAAGAFASFAQTRDGRLFGTGFYGFPWSWGVDLDAFDPGGFNRYVSQWVQIHTGPILQLRAYGGFQVVPWIIDTSHVVWHPQFVRNVDPVTFEFTYSGSWIQPFGTRPFSFLSRGESPTVHVTLDGHLLQGGTTEFSPPLTGSYTAATWGFPPISFLLTGPVPVPPPTLTTKPFVTCQAIGPI
jgi:Regulator of chromosome condensation (RCC1) repeat